MQLDAEDDEQPYYKPPVVPLPSEQASESLSGETQAESAVAISAHDEE